MSFCRDEDPETFEIIKDLHLFARKLYLLVLLDRSSEREINFTELFKGYSVQDFFTFKDLILLFQERENLQASDLVVLYLEVDELLAKSSGDVSAISLRFKPKSKAIPLFIANPSIASFVKLVTKKIENLHFQRGSGGNLQPHLSKAIHSLQKNKSIIQTVGGINRWMMK